MIIAIFKYDLISKNIPIVIPIIVAIIIKRKDIKISICNFYTIYIIYILYYLYSILSIFYIIYIIVRIKLYEEIKN